MEHGSGRKAYVTMLLIGLNVLFFLYLEIAGSSEDVYFMYEHGALFAPAVTEQGEYYRLVTAMFMHFGIHHIMNNMIVLFAIGDRLERAMGHIRFLILYLLSGVGSNYLSLMLKGASSNAISAGASGAVFGVVGGLLYAVFANRGCLGDLNSRQIFFMAVLSLYLGFSEAGVDNAAHIAGLILGILLGIILYRKPKEKIDRRNNVYEGY